MCSGEAPHGQTSQPTVSTKKMPLGVSVATGSSAGSARPPLSVSSSGVGWSPRPPHALCACLRGTVSSWLLPSAPSEPPVRWGRGADLLLLSLPPPVVSPARVKRRPRADHATLPTRSARPPKAGSASRACLTPRLDADQRLTLARQNC